MKKLFILLLALLLISVPILVRILTQETSERYERETVLMDTRVRIVAYGDKNTPDYINKALQKMRELENILSIYNEYSEAYQLNKNGYIEGPSPHLLYLIKDSLYFHNLTNGAFDITVQPLLDLWSAGLWKANETAQDRMVNETLSKIGSDKIVVNENEICFKAKGMKITLGGIAKGYIVDRGIEVLRDQGVKSALIDAGGDMYCVGLKPSGEPWTVSLENPDNPRQAITSFKVSDVAIVTSGNYERYFSPDKKVHHIIDPRTGFSASPCISVTIIAENGVQADALSTSVFVLGPDDGINLIESLPDVEGLIIDNDKSIYRSSGVSRYEAPIS